MIDLPAHPAPAEATPALVDFGGIVQGALGGPAQRINRLGNRFRLAVALPPLPSAQLGRQWVAALLRAKRDGGRMSFPQPGFDPGAPGSPVIDGGGPVGRVLPIRGAQPGYAFRQGQFFSIETAGQHYLFVVAAETAVAADGSADLPIDPPIRAAHADGDVLHVGDPKIEGLVDGDEFAWSLSLGPFHGISFTLTERE